MNKYKPTELKMEALTPSILQNDVSVYIIFGRAKNGIYDKFETKFADARMKSPWKLIK